MTFGPATTPPEHTATVPLPLIERIDLGLDRVDPRARWRRIGQVAWVLTRRLGPVPVTWLAEGRRRPLRDLLGAPLEAAAFDLGVTFVKLGQLLASSPSLAGEVLADAMRGVLDQGPAVPRRPARSSRVSSSSSRATPTTGRRWRPIRRWSRPPSRS